MVGVKCVLPSTVAVTEDAYPDFVVNDDPMFGFALSAKGCQTEGDASVLWVTEPADLVSQVPDITVQSVVIDAALRVGPDNVLRGEGSFTSPKVVLGATEIGPASGPVRIRLVPAAEAPTDIPPFDG